MGEFRHRCRQLRLVLTLLVLVRALTVVFGRSCYKTARHARAHLSTLRGVGGRATDLPDEAGLAERVRHLRQALGLTQEQLAREIGVSFVTVNRWESGKARISAGGLKRLAELERSRPAGRPARLESRFLTSFVGRQAEMAELERLLDENRLVTVVGPGGVGKTRLATEVVRCGDGARPAFVALEPVPEEEGLLSAVAAELKVRDRPGAEPFEAVALAVEGAGSVLVLDGAERWRDAVAELVSRLLRETTECRIVVTSRRVLEVAGEVVFPLGPLSCPDPGAPVNAVLSSEAVRLFLARARERLPRLEPTDLEAGKLAALCHRLDGLPLAIELMAGWAGTLSVNEILERASLLLEAEPSGQASGLREVLAQSWQLLTFEQQDFIAQLSVIRGSFELDDAAVITASEPVEAARLLRQMVDSSFLVVRPGVAANRFQMLETMRAFVSSQMDEALSKAASTRHAGHFAAIARSGGQAMLAPGALSRAEHLSLAWPDIEVALHHLAAERRLEEGLEAATALWPWWLASGRLALGRAELGSFLSLAGGRDDELVARANCAAAVLAAEHGAYHEARSRAARAKRTFERHGRLADTAMAATVIGSACRYLDDVEGSRAAFSEALALRRKLADERGIAVALNNLALLALDAASYEEAARLFSDSISAKRRLKSKGSLAVGLSNYATVLVRQGRLDEAEGVLEEASAMAGELGNPQLDGSLAANFGELAAARGDQDAALSHFEASLEAIRKGGNPHDEVVALIGMGRALSRLGRRAAALDRLREAEALAAATGNLTGLNKSRAALAETGEAARSRLPGGLTEREAEVLRLLALGSSTKEIAGSLGLKVRTVEHHLESIYRKLGASGRVAAARWALSHGLVGAGA